MIWWQNRLSLFMQILLEDLAMKRLPLSDQHPYTFIPPRHSAVWYRLGTYYSRLRIRREQKIEEYDIQGLERLQSIVAAGDSVLITPNHPDHADCYVFFELSRRLGKPLSYLAAYQIFTGMARWVLPRVGVFSIDREGADLSAFKTAVTILAEGKYPLVIFPEGEIYRVAERITPLREGAFSIAASAARKLEGTGRKLWIVPVGLCYRFLEGHDPLPELRSLMDRLESRFTWRVQSHRPLVERILNYAHGILGLKEVEYLGSPRPGTFKERATSLIEQILAPIEAGRLKGRKSATIPERVKDLRRACLEALQDQAISENPDASRQVRNDLDDLFLVIQIFSYPGDYLQKCPTLERVAETLMKCEEDFLQVDQAPPRAPRRAVVRIGEPIDLTERLAAPGQSRSRQLVPALTAEMETRIQALLDAMPPGKVLCETEAGLPRVQSPPPEQRNDVVATKAG
jgi:1-acyl-sn-glycerol-3-phosphate acyltransferase